jgi:nucleotide-binding universal stress UspA family protein
MQKHAENAWCRRQADVACETVQVEHEHPYQAIIDIAVSTGCDFIAVASHGRHGVSAIVLGSETVKMPRKFATRAFDAARLKAM